MTIAELQGLLKVEFDLIGVNNDVSLPVDEWDELSNECDSSGHAYWRYIGINGSPLTSQAIVFTTGCGGRSVLVHKRTSAELTK